MEPIEQREGFILLRVRVQPKSSRNAVSVEPDGRIRVALTAPPVEGAANQALVEVIAKTVGLPKRSVTLFSGEKSRDKTVKLVGITLQGIAQKLGS